MMPIDIFSGMPSDVTKLAPPSTNAPTFWPSPNAVPTFFGDVVSRFPSCPTGKMLSVNLELLIVVTGSSLGVEFVHSFPCRRPHSMRR